MSQMSIQFAIACALSLSTAPAAEVTLRGKVEDVQHTQNEFFVDCTSVRLTSTAFDLNLFVGSQVRITGDWNGSFVAPSVEVAAIETVAETFGIGGGGKIGDELQLKVTSTPGDFTIMFAAIDESFVPTRRGVLFLGFPMLTIGFGAIPGIGNLEIRVSVPDDPALVGLVVRGQALLAFAAGGSTWTNPDCKTLQN